MRPATVLRFATPRRVNPRPSKKTLLGVSRIIALAPVLGRCNPQSVSTVTDIMETLIGEPPTGGSVAPEASRPATAADTRIHSRRRHASRATAFTTVWADAVFVPACERLGSVPALASRSA